MCLNLETKNVGKPTLRRDFNKPTESDDNKWDGGATGDNKKGVFHETTSFKIPIGVTNFVRRQTLRQRPFDDATMRWKESGNTRASDYSKKGHFNQTTSIENPRKCH